jgi:hypothetical protein
MIGADSLEALRGRCVLPLVVERDRADFEAICQAAFRGEPGWLQFELPARSSGRRGRGR